MIHAHGAGASPVEPLALLLAAGALAAYAAGVILSARRGRPWPWRRSLLWAAGVVAAAATVVGPLPRAGHDSFVAHMLGHLLAGMVAPLLLVLAAPVTLALRALAVTPARRLSRVLSSWPGRVLAHPAAGAALSIGGLWLIYGTDVLGAVQDSALVHAVVHLHLVAASFLFTAAVIRVDPAPHRARRPVTATVLVIAIAGHAIVAKQLFAQPPAGFAVADVQAGAQLMYYAGAYVEAVVVVLFCAAWYREVGAARLRAERA